MEDLKITMQLASVLGHTAERNATSVVCDFCKDDVNEECLHSKTK